LQSQHDLFKSTPFVHILAHTILAALLGRALLDFREKACWLFEARQASGLHNSHYISNMHSMLRLLAYILRLLHTLRNSLLSRFCCRHINTIHVHVYNNVCACTFVVKKAATSEPQIKLPCRTSIDLINGDWPGSQEKLQALKEFTASASSQLLGGSLAADSVYMLT